MSINRDCSVWAKSANTHHAHQLGTPFKSTDRASRLCIMGINWDDSEICKIEPQPNIMRIVSNCCSVPDANQTATHHQHHLGSLLGMGPPSGNTPKHYQHQLGMLRLTDRDWTHSHTSRASAGIDQENQATQASVVGMGTLCIRTETEHPTTLHQHQLVPLPRPRSGTTATHDEHELGLLRCI